MSGEGKERRSNVFSLDARREENESQALMRLLRPLEAFADYLNSLPPTEEQVAEQLMIDDQIEAIKCVAEIKILLIRALKNPALGEPSKNRRLIKILEDDHSVIYHSDREFWDAHKPKWYGMTAGKKRAFLKKMNGKPKPS